MAFHAGLECVAARNQVAVVAVGRIRKEALGFTGGIDQKDIDIVLQDAAAGIGRLLQSSLRIRGQNELVFLAVVDRRFRTRLTGARFLEGQTVGKGIVTARRSVEIQPGVDAAEAEGEVGQIRAGRFPIGAQRVARAVRIYSGGVFQHPGVFQRIAGEPARQIVNAVGGAGDGSNGGVGGALANRSTERRSLACGWQDRP